MPSQNYYEIFLLDSTTGSTGNYVALDTEDIDLSNTFQVADIASIDTRKDAITKTLSFKATKNNNIIFGNLSNLNRVVDDSFNLSFLFNFNITKDVDCQVYENSILIFSGKLSFIAANRDVLGNLTYDCCIKGYMVDFFSKISDKLISDLDFTPFNHSYNIQNIQDSWSNIYYKNGVRTTGGTSDGYKYCFIDYGAGVTTETSFDNKIDYRNFRPAFSLKEYFNAIFNQTGITGNYRYLVTGSTAFLDEYHKAIVPNNDSDFSYSQTPQILFEVAKTVNPIQYNGNNQTFHDSTNNRTEYSHLITFDKLISGGTGQSLIATGLTNGQRITFNNRINTTVSASVSFTSGQLSPYNLTLRFQCLYRTSPTGQFTSIAEVTQHYDYTAVHDPIQNNPAQTLNLSVSQVFELGSEMAFVVMLESTATYLGGIAVTIFNSDIQIGSTVSTSQVTLKINDPAILVGQNTQSIKQVDFLKSVIQMFNLYVYPDQDDYRRIIFTPYNDYYSNFTAANIINSAIDWTDKIDNATFSITPASDIFNLYKFVFKDDTDFFSKFYKDKYGDTYGNLTLTGSTNGSDKSIELIFGSTPVSAYKGRSVPYLWELDTNNLKKTKVTAPRLLFYNGLKNCETYEIGIISLSAATNNYVFQSIDSANTTDYIFSQYAEANEFTLSSTFEFVDLTFSTPKEVFYTDGGITTSFGSGKQNLYDRYYADQISELTDSNTRIIETTAYLSEVDIQNLDFRRPIYFNSVLGHNYFKLLSVEYSNSNTPSTIKLQTAYIKDNNVAFTGYKSAIYADFISKNDCSTAGYAGEATYYLVPAGKYISFISQSIADALAVNEANTLGQAYANTNGVCVNTGATFSLGLDDNPKDATTGTRQNFVTDTGTLNTGSIIFGFAGTKPTREVSAYYGNDNFYYQTDTHSTIIFSATTASISGTTYDAYFGKDVSRFQSCSAAYAGDYIKYQISDPYPRVGTTVKDSTATTPVADGWYSDGYNAYQTVSGVVTNVLSCKAGTIS